MMIILLISALVACRAEVNFIPTQPLSNITSTLVRSNATSIQSRPYLKSLSSDLTLLHNPTLICPADLLKVDTHQSAIVSKAKIEILHSGHCFAQFKCSFSKLNHMTKFDVVFVSDLFRKWHLTDFEYGESFEHLHTVVPTDIRATPFVTVDTVNKVATTKIFHTAMPLQGCYSCVVDGVSSNFIEFRVKDICPIKRNPGNDAPKFTITRQKGCSSRFECSFYCVDELDCAPEVKFYLVGKSLIPFSKRWFELHTLDSYFVIDKTRHDTRKTQIIEVEIFHYMKVKWKCSVRGIESNEVYLQVHGHCHWLPPPQQDSQDTDTESNAITRSSAHRHMANLLMCGLIVVPLVNTW